MIRDQETIAAGCDLPPSIQEIADVIGPDQALYLIGKLPQSGSRPWRVAVYVPSRLPTDHRLVRILGWKDAYRLSKRFGGEILQPSSGAVIERRFRNRTILELRAQGMTAREIGDFLDVNFETVKKVMRAAPGGSPPMASTPKTSQPAREREQTQG